MSFLTGSMAIYWMYVIGSSNNLGWVQDQGNSNIYQSYYSMSMLGLVVASCQQHEEALFDGEGLAPSEIYCY